MDFCNMHACPRPYCEWQHAENADQRRKRVRLTTLTNTGNVVIKSKR